MVSDCLPLQDTDTRESLLQIQATSKDDIQGARSSAQMKKSKTKAKVAALTQRSVSEPMVNSEQVLRLSTATDDHSSLTTVVNSTPESMEQVVITSPTEFNLSPILETALRDASPILRYLHAMAASPTLSERASGHFSQDKHLRRTNVAYAFSDRLDELLGLVQV